MQTKGILRTEIRLTKPKAIRAVTEAVDTSGQIAEMAKNSMDIFMDISAHIIPHGDFYKKDKVMDIIWKEVKDNVMRRKILRLLALIPEKKSLHLAQKIMNCRNIEIEQVMDAFAKINLSPITISKQQDVKYMKNLYSYFLDF